MAKKQKRKLTRAEKAEKKRRRELYQTIFINGKQKSVRREPLIDGLPVDEFIRRNADPVWLVQNEMWEELYELESADSARPEQPSNGNLPTTIAKLNCEEDLPLPF